MHLKLQVSTQVALDVSCGLYISIRQLRRRLVGSISNMKLSLWLLWLWYLCLTVSVSGLLVAIWL